VFDGVPQLSVNRVILDGLELYIDMQGSDIISLRKRLVKTPTLDGGCVIQDFGLTDADRLLRLVVNVNLTQASLIKHIFETSTIHEVSTFEGSFQCVGLSYKDTFGRVEMELEVINKTASVIRHIAAAYASGAL